MTSPTSYGGLSTVYVSGCKFVRMQYTTVIHKNAIYNSHTQRMSPMFYQVLAATSSPHPQFLPLSFLFPRPFSPVRLTLPPLIPVFDFPRPAAAALLSNFSLCSLGLRGVRTYKKYTLPSVDGRFCKAQRRPLRPVTLTLIYRGQLS